MNEFTKEELQIISLDMSTYIRSRPMLSESPSHKALRDKIKSMIDGYCEHVYVLRCHDSVIYCPKCGKEQS